MNEQGKDADDVPGAVSRARWPGCGHGRPEPALVSDAADPARRNQPQALGLVKLFDHAVSHGSTLASWAGAVTFNPDAMDFRPCRQPAVLTKLVVEVNKPSGGSHASPRLPRSWAEGLGRST